MSNECKGLYWRGSENTYLSSHGSVELRKSLRLLKRKSCSGCEDCGWILEEIKDAIYNEALYIDNIEHGQTYMLKFTLYRGYFDLSSEIEDIWFEEVEDVKEIN